MSGAAPTAVHVLVEQPGEGPRLIALGDGTWDIGRDADCAVVLADTRASRRHARLSVAGDHVVLTDLGSRNGTFVNGAAVVGDVAIGDDDLIVIGSARLAARRQWAAGSPAVAG